MKTTYFRAVLLGSLALTVGAAQGANPSLGTISLSNPELTYASGPFNVSNTSGTAGDPICNAASPCDNFALTVDLPADFSTSHPEVKLRIETSWDGATEDYDLYLYDSSDAVVASSPTGANPEVIEIPPGQGVAQYTVQIVPFTVTGTSTSTKIALIGAPAGAGASGPATLVASVRQGSAPLSVQFSVTDPPGDNVHLVTYSVDFGDGQKIENELFNEQGRAGLGHDYLDDGSYTALLSVTDASGTTYSNISPQEIRVGNLAQGSGVAVGLLPLTALLVLVGFRVSRRRAA